MAGVGTWLQATRPRTLPAAVVPVAVGTAVAARGLPHWAPAIGCLVGSLLIQIGCNFANDAFDTVHGADTAERVGPQRAVAAGLISVRTMLLATALVLAAAFLVGLYLTAIAAWPIMVLGLVSITCAIAYTGGPFPLAYHGLGEVFVFLFFGLAAVLGSWWVQFCALQAPFVWQLPPGQLLSGITRALALRPLPLWLACAVGLQCTAIICVNNIRDRISDAATGKRTVAVRLGDRPSRMLYGLVHVGAVLCLVGVARLLQAQPDVHRAAVAVAWAAVAVAALGGLVLTRGVFVTNGMVLNRYLPRSAALEMLTGALLVISLSI